jgi:murein DD-endopeptidase MepM/ murein hydrolase activator NlpD
MPSNPIIGLQKGSASNSLMFEITRGRRVLLTGIFAVAFMGLISLLTSLIIWSYQSYSFHYYKKQNLSLKKDLSGSLNKQNDLIGLIDHIGQSEKNLRLCYGLENHNIIKYATGGRQTPDELFIKSVSPLQKKYSELSFTQNSLAYNVKQTFQHFQQLQSYIQYMDDIWKHTPVTFPANGRLTSKYGYRIHPVSGLRRFHFGVDIATPKWTEVYASADGKVASTKYSSSFGNIVTIDHGNGFATHYAHLAKYMVEKGQLIKRYDLIGYVGRSGLVTGSHLHYEVHRDGHSRNPINYMLPDDILVD